MHACDKECSGADATASGLEPEYEHGDHSWSMGPTLDWFAGAARHDDDLSVGSSSLNETSTYHPDHPDLVAEEPMSVLGGHGGRDGGWGPAMVGGRPAMRI